VEPSPAGGYVVRLAGHDVPVSRHDTEEEAEEWVARHAGSLAGEAAPVAPSAVRPRFAGLDDGTQVILRAPGADDPDAVRTAACVAVDPATGAVVGAVDRTATWVADAWSGRGLEAALRDAGV
jgi:hypothetical protein